MKLKLELEALTVQSFSAEPPPAVDGDGLFAPSAIAFTECHTDCSCPPYW